MKFLSENIWVWAGTGLVLITLSGETRQYGIFISGTAVLLHLVATLLKKDSE